MDGEGKRMRMVVALKCSGNDNISGKYEKFRLKMAAFCRICCNFAFGFDDWKIELKIE